MVKLNKEEEKQKIQEEKAHNKENTAKSKPTIKIKANLEDLGIVFYPLVTEKAVNIIDSENKITFIVADNANKKNIKETIQKTYNIKVNSVNIIRDRKGRKKAIVKLSKENKAQDLATKIGVL